QGMDFSSLAAANTRLFSGFAGWAPGQLETEIRRGDWHTWQANAAIIFSQAPDELWGDLIDLASAKWVMR
ncbi:MAG TPA: YqgE/AlgH family protein, partial [Gammaproteobacteria bacterium]|nr:YqgE/AlgH family protein [Gammaproteobacteria bacterium]